MNRKQYGNNYEDMLVEYNKDTSKIEDDNFKYNCDEQLFFGHSQNESSENFSSSSYNNSSLDNDSYFSI